MFAGGAGAAARFFGRRTAGPARGRGRLWDRVPAAADFNSNPLPDGRRSLRHGTPGSACGKSRGDRTRNDRQGRVS